MAVSAVSVIALIWIAKTVFQTRTRTQATEQQVIQLRKETETLKKDAEAIRSELTTEQKETLKSAHLLVDRKRFSWSRLFVDLEETLPGTVKVTRIVVKDVGTINGRTVADLDLAVACKSSEVVTQLIEDMEREGVFTAYLKSQDLLRGRGESGSVYEMQVRYTPRAGVPLQVAERKKPVDTASGTGSTAQ